MFAARQLPPLFLAVFVLALLTACSVEKGAVVPAQSTAAASADMHTSQNSLDWSGVYEGILDCADCPGTRTRLTLVSDGSYALDSLQLKHDAHALSVRGQFSWQPDGNSVLLDSAGAGQQFAVGEGRLTLLNSDGTRPAPETSNRALALLASGQAATNAVSTSLLQDHRWSLRSATAGANQRIDVLFPKNKPFELSFTASTLVVTGGCNSLRGSYQIDAEGQLQAARMASTMIACVPALMHADSALSALLAQPLRMVLVQGAQPRLILVSPINEVLIFDGAMTPEALYGPATRIFLEVAAQTAACQDPPSSDTQCLQVREIKFDEQGLKVGTPGEWQPFSASIEGYQHTPGVRNVLRVNRFQPASTGTEAQPQAVYVLDMVVESEIKPN